MATPNNFQVKPTPSPPGAGGGVPSGVTVHEAVEQLRQQLEAEGKTVDEAKLWEAVYKQIHPKKKLNHVAVRANYENQQLARQSRPAEVSTRQDLNRAAGLENSALAQSASGAGVGDRAPSAGESESIQENGFEGDKSISQGSGSAGHSDSVHTPETSVPSVDAVSPGVAEGVNPEDSGGQTAPATGTGKDDTAESSPAEQADAAPEPVASEPGKKQTKSKKSEQQRGAGDSEAPGVGNAENSAASARQKSADAAGGPTHGTGSKAKGGTDLLGPDAQIPGQDALGGVTPGDAKRLRDAARYGGAKPLAKEAVRQAASQGADKVFNALLEASPTDLGILTIGFAGTALLVLGHMFGVKLQSWQKWIVVGYDIVLFILIMIIVAIVVAAYCNIPPPLGGMLSSSCSGFRFWNLLF